MSDTTLLILLDDVRGKTLRELEKLDDAHARWAPPGLQNCCLWHAGHAYVVVEFLTMKALGQEPRIPGDWLKMFSWESNPAHIPPDTWPPLEEIVGKLHEQHGRLRRLIAELTPEQLDAQEVSNPSHSVRFAIMHGLHDEARHSGEITLLRKLMTRTFVVNAPTWKG